jgi:hypothetical protein
MDKIKPKKKKTRLVKSPKKKKGSGGGGGGGSYAHITKRVPLYPAIMPNI